MKVCILSMQRVNNFGSLLQSYSLKKLIESMGHEVSFIDIKPSAEDDALINHEDIFNSSEREGDSFASKIRKIDRYTFNRIRIKQKAKQQNEKFEMFRKEVLGIKSGDNEKKYDICVIGSDEVFNCYGNSKWGFTSQLFGNVAQADRVITYAASCGSTKYENLSESAKKVVKNAFTNIEGFSVRDENTKEFVEKFTDKVILQNFDPVIFGNFNWESESTGDEIALPEHYCIIYSYYNRIHTRDEISMINEFAQRKKMKIISVGAPQYWINTHMVLSPFEIISVFKNADYVITDTFHGTIFSYKFAKRYAIIMRESNKNKLADLIRRLEIEEHLFSKEKNSLDKIFTVNSDKEKVCNVEKMAEKSAREYLNLHLK